MDEETENQLSAIVEGTDRSLKWAKDKYGTLHAEAKAKFVGTTEDPDEMAHKTAIQGVRKDVEVPSGGGGFGGDAEELPVLTLGYAFREGNYFVTQEDALVGLGIVNPPEDPAGVAVFILDSAHGIDLDHARTVFKPLNVARVWTARMQTDQLDNKGGKPVYICNSTDNSKMDIVEADEAADDPQFADLPQTKEEKRALIHEHFITEADEVTLQNVTEHLTKTNSNGFEAAFGADVKRFTGQLVDSYRSFDSGFGTMTLVDDTIESFDEISDELIQDENRTPGLQVLIDPEHIEYGENSRLEVIGWVERTDDGQVRMRGFGIIPIVGMDRTEDDGPSGQSSGPDHESETI